MKKELDGKVKEIKLLSETLREMQKNFSNAIENIVEKNEIIEKDVQYLKVEKENLKAQIKERESEIETFKKEIEVKFLDKKR